MATFENRRGVSNQVDHQTVNGNLYFDNVSDENAKGHEECLRALLLEDPREMKEALKASRGNRATGTCEWFLDVDELKAWQDATSTSSSIFWLLGHPGTGKSTLAIFLVDWLESQYAASPETLLAYYFYDSTLHDQNTATAMLRGLMYQLCRHHPILLDKYLLPEHRIKKDKLFESFDALWLIFSAMARDQPTGQKYFIIDGLDECDDKSQRRLLERLERSAEQSPSGPSLLMPRFLITSRPYRQIQDILSHFPHRDMASFPEVRRDVEILIAEKVAKLAVSRRYTPKIRQRVTEILEDKAEGTFLWVGLACAELSRPKLSTRRAIELLNNLPAGLTSMYDDLLRRALEEADQEDEGSEVVTRILSTVSVAHRPLTVSELAVACGLHESEDNEERDSFTEETVDLCRFMVVVDEKYVRLLHKSVKDFLFQSATIAFPSLLEAHAQLSYRCIDRLIVDYHDQRTKKSFRFRRPFLEYSARFWGQHAHLAEEQFTVQHHQHPFFTPISKSRNAWSTFALALGECIPFDASLFHIAAHWGICPLVDYARRCIILSELEGAHRPVPEELSEKMKGFRSNPLELAVRSGHVDVFRRLLALGAREVDGKLTVTVTDESSSNTEINHERTNLYSFPVSRHIVKAIVRSRAAGSDMLKALIELRRPTHFTDESILTEIAQNEINGQQIMMILIENYGDAIQLSEDVLMLMISNPGYEDSFIELLLASGVIVGLTPATMLSLTECRSDLFNDQNLDRLSRNLEITDDLMVSLINSKFEKYASPKMSYDSEPSLLQETAGIDHANEDTLESAIQDTLSGENTVRTLLRNNPDMVIPGHVIVRAASNHVFGKQIIGELFSHTVTGKVSMSEVLYVAATSESDVHGIAETFLSHHPDRVHHIGSEVLLALIDGCTRQAEPSFLENARQSMNFLLTRDEIHLTVKDVIVEAVAATNTPEQYLVSWLQRQGDSRLQGREIPWDRCVNKFFSDTLQSLVDLSDDPQVAFSGLVKHIVKCNERRLLETFVFDRSETPSRDASFTSALQAAVMYGKKALLQELIDCGAAVRSSPGAGSSLTGMAAQQGNIEMMKLLLKAGARFDLPDETGKTPLGHTLQILPDRDNRVAIAQLLLDKGADPNSHSHELYGNILTEAMMTTNYRIAEMLLEKGANPNIRAGYYGNVLQAAARANVPFDIIDRLLLDEGADINAQGGRHGNALAAALWDDHLQLAYFLFQHGAKLTPESVRDQLTRTNPPITKPTLCFVLRLIDDVQGIDGELGEQLRASVETCSPAIARIHTAQECLSLCRMLHEFGVNMSTSDWTKRTALHEASAVGSAATVRWLILAGASVDDVDLFGCTALHYAVQEDLAVVEVLLEAGADITARDSSGSTVLHRATSSGRLEIIECLVDRLVLIQQACGSDDFASTILNHVNDFRETAFQLALRKMDNGISRFLAMNGALHSSPDSNSATTEMGTAAGDTAQELDSWPGMSAIKTASELLEAKQREISATIDDIIKHASTTDISSCHILTRFLTSSLQHDDAVTAWEQVVRPSESDPNMISHLGHGCDGCDRRPITGVRHWCKSCPSYDLCADCWRKRQSGQDANASTCAHPPEHFARIPRLPRHRDPHVINDRGETKEEWAERLKRPFEFLRTSRVAARPAASSSPSTGL